MTTLDIILILFFTIFYCIWFMSYRRKEKIFFFITFFTLSIFHDYIFIHLGYAVSDITILVIKSWQEYLLFFLVSVLLSKKSLKTEKDVFIVLIGVFFLTIWGVVIGGVRGVSLFEVYIGWRSYILPLLIGLLLFIEGGFRLTNFNFFQNFFVLIALLSVMGALYQEAIFKKYNLGETTVDSMNFLEKREAVLKEFWFFKKFGALHMLRSWPNYFRSEHLRATSFFVSPISFAEFLVIPIVILLVKMSITKGNLFKSKYWLVLLLLIAGSYLSNARIGIMLVAMSIFIVWIISHARYSSGILWALVLGVICFTFFSLIVLRIGDDSAQGRLTQYQEMINNFSIFGFGFGSVFSTSYFDSMYISVIMLFGVGSIIYFLIHFYIVQLIFRGLGTQDEWKKVLPIISITLALCFTFAFAFQYSIGSGTIMIMYFIFFLTISQNRVITGIR